MRIIVNKDTGEVLGDIKDTPSEGLNVEIKDTATKKVLTVEQEKPEEK